MGQIAIFHHAHLENTTPNIHTRMNILVPAAPAECAALSALTTTELATLRVLCSDARRLRDARDNHTREPSEEMGRLRSEAEAEMAAIEERYKAEVAALYERRKKELEAAKMKTAPRRREIAAVIRALNEEYDLEYNALKARATGLIDRATFADLVSALPEDLRPGLIPVPGCSVFLVQIKSAPTCAVIVQARPGGDAKGGAQVDAFFAQINHRLVCFSAPCMDDAGRKRALNAIAALCKEHGITDVFGRKVGCNCNGVSFYDCESFKYVMDTVCASGAGQHVWICE